MPKEELADALQSIAGASHEYMPPDNDPLAAMNDAQRFEANETIADLLRELRDKNHIAQALCLQAAEQLLAGRPADSVALTVEDR